MAVDFWPFFASHFDLTVGDLLDGRFELTLLEHWIKVFHGNAQWASPNFFYPVNGILGLSDAFLGLAIPHAMFRSLGADQYLAVQLATMLLTAFGFMAMYFLLRSPLHFARSTALLGASLFVIANTNHINVIHPYILVPVMVAPALFVLAARYWQDKDSHRTKARVWRFLCPLLLALILYTSYYVGWFLILSSVVLCVAYLMCRVYVERSRQPLLYAINTEVQEQGFLLGGAVLVAALIPFLTLYVPASRHTGNRSVADSVHYLQPPSAIIDVGRDNLVWGALSARIESHNSPKGIIEYPTGWPILTLCLFLATAMYCLIRLRRSRNDADAAERQTLCWMSAISLTCIVLWPAGVRIGQSAPAWTVLLKLAPGAAAIRVPQRIHLVLNIGVVIICMFGLERLRKALIGRGALAYLVPALLGCALLVEQLNYMPTHLISRSSEARKFSRISAPPRECSAFYVSNWSDNRFGKNLIQTDGMMVAQIYDIPTINGMTSWVPIGWNLYDAAKGHVTEEAFSWAHSRGLSEGLCALDVDSGLWSKNDLSHLDPSPSR